VNLETAQQYKQC